MIRSRLLLPFILCGVLIAGAASAESWAYDLSAELMSPYCPGRTLASCPSPQAAELVQWMVLQESAGSSQEEVIAILIERFGEGILGAPPAEGINLWAYIFPVLGFVVGGGLAFVALRRIVGGSDSTDRPTDRPTDRATGNTAADPAMASAGSGAVAHAVAGPSSPTANAARSAVTDDELARLVDAELAARG